MKAVFIKHDSSLHGDPGYDITFVVLDADRDVLMEQVNDKLSEQETWDGEYLSASATNVIQTIKELGYTVIYDAPRLVFDWDSDQLLEDDNWDWSKDASREGQEGWY